MAVCGKLANVKSSNMQSSAADQYLNFPRTIRDSRRHRWRDPQRAANAAKIATRKM
jgi:hypothetical protein